MNKCKGMLIFPNSRVSQFKHTDKNLRWGQAFHQFMQLEKCEQDREFCDMLYNASDEKAKNMVRERIDTTN